MRGRERDFEETGESPNFWALSDMQLAKSCVLIAESESDPASEVVRAEATRLFLLWRDAINSSDRPGFEREQRAALLSGLRKRTIQILVRLTVEQEAATPAR